MNSLFFLDVHDTLEDRISEPDPLGHGEVCPVEEAGDVGEADNLLRMPLKDRAAKSQEAVPSPHISTGGDIIGAD